MYYVKHKSKNRLPRAARIVLLLSVIALFIALNSSIGQVMNKAAQTQLQNRFSQALAQSIDLLLEENYSFTLSKVDTSETGQIVSIQTDTAGINRIRSTLSSILLSKLGEMEQQPVSVTVGSLTGVDMFAGIGPGIDLRFELRGGLQTEITSEFVEAGINQTLHRINCVITADYYIILPWHKFSTTVSSKVPLCESVIVGEVPDAYTYVVGDQSDTISRIFDYAHLDP